MNGHRLIDFAYRLSGDDREEESQAKTSLYFFEEKKHIQPYGKHEYKNHPNGRGIEIWNCRQCGDPLNNVAQRGQKREVCTYCSIENRALRERMRIFTNKVMKVLYP